MVDREPIPINPNDLGIQTTTTQVPEFKKPLVSRSPRGHIRWRLSRNTPEQNEQLGIRNFQGLLLECFPEFNIRFRRDANGQILEEQRKEAASFISAAITDEKFRRLTTSVTSRVSAPYFEGSHTKAAQKSFAPWGVEIASKPTRRSPGFFSDATNIETEAEKALKIGITLTDEGLLKAGLNGLRTGISRHYPGGFKGIQEKYGIEQKQKPRNYWSKEMIEAEVEKQLKTGVKLTKKSLQEAQLYALLSAIYDNYPGKLRALQRKYNVEALTKSVGYWSSLGNIETEIEAAVSQNIPLSVDTLRKAGKSSLVSAITRNYPGGMEGAQKKYELKQTSPEGKGEALLREYTDLLLDGQVMSYEEFMKMKEKLTEG